MYINDNDQHYESKLLISLKNGDAKQNGGRLKC